MIWKNHTCIQQRNFNDGLKLGQAFYLFHKPLCQANHFCFFLYLSQRKSPKLVRSFSYHIVINTGPNNMKLYQLTNSTYNQLDMLIYVQQESIAPSTIIHMKQSFTICSFIHSLNFVYHFSYFALLNYIAFTVDTKKYSFT